MWCHWVSTWPLFICCRKWSFFIMSLKCPSATTTARIGHWAHNGFSDRSVDPNTFLAVALLLKNFLNSCVVSSFLVGHEAVPLLGKVRQQLCKNEKLDMPCTTFPSRYCGSVLALGLLLTSLRVLKWIHFSSPFLLSCLANFSVARLMMLIDPVEFKESLAALETVSTCTVTVKTCQLFR